MPGNFSEVEEPSERNTPLDAHILHSSDLYAGHLRSSQSRDFPYDKPMRKILNWCACKANARWVLHEKARLLWFSERQVANCQLAAGQWPDSCLPPQSKFLRRGPVSSCVTPALIIVTSVPTNSSMSLSMYPKCVKSPLLSHLALSSA